MSTSSTSGVSFTGVSQYASDFQASLTRAVSIAQIPLKLLQSQDSVLLQKQTDLGTLGSAVSSLTTSLKSLGIVAEGQGLSATSSDSKIVSVVNTGAKVATSYTINSVTSVAAAASERTLDPIGDSTSTPVSASGTMRLVAGSFDETFSLDNNTLVGLRDQINSFGAGVTASILTTPDGNYLSISANSTGETTLQLIEDPDGTPANILTSTNQGSDAEFQLNGIDIKQSSNTVNNVTPGLTFSILDESDDPVTLSLKTDSSQLSNALQDFVDDYNSLQGVIQQQVGPNGGSLAGDAIVRQLQSVLRHITGYTSSSGTILGLANLGVTFNQTGAASFDTAKLNSLTATQLSDAFKFIGSITAGFAGFSNQLSQISDPLSGLIAMEQTGLKRADLHLQAQMDTLTARIEALQASLTVQMEAADAREAALEQKQASVTASMQALSLVLYGKNETKF